MAGVAVAASLGVLVAPEPFDALLFLGAVLCSAAVTWMSNFMREGDRRH